MRTWLRLGSPAWRSLAAVALGGGIGASARFELAEIFAAPTPPAFPTLTLAINVAGAFLLGGLMALIVDLWPPTRYVRPLVGIGILGGFTTFSTFVVEGDRLIEAGQTGLALAYVIVSLLLGLVAVALGTSVAHRVWPAIARPRTLGPDG
jgi:CrcB protein